MGGIGQPERATQNRVILLFRDELGYRYLGDWTDRDGNSNIEDGILTTYLTRSGYTAAQISVALYKLCTEADNHSRSLYANNQAVYSLLPDDIAKAQKGGTASLAISVPHIDMNRAFAEQLPAIDAGSKGRLPAHALCLAPSRAVLIPVFSGPAAKPSS